jgi:ELWxxDGT repeat protein
MTIAHPIERLEPRRLLAAGPQTLGSEPQNFFNANGSLLFAADDRTTGPALYKSDGTAAGTTLLKDIGAQPGDFVAFNAAIYFGANNGLWRTDGTSAGTTLVSALDTPINQYLTRHAVDLTVLNNTLYFSAGDVLFKSDGTTTGTVPLKTFGDYYDIQQVTAAGNLIYFLYNPSSGPELWKSDGTPAGTQLVKKIPVPKATDFSKVALDLVGFNNHAYLRIFTPDGGSHLWLSDGTTAGTIQLKDLNPDSDSNIQRMRVIGGMLYFAATDGTHGTQLWKIRPSLSDTPKPITRSFNTIDSVHFAQVNGIIYFPADDGVHGTELWKIDPLTAATTLVKDITPGNKGSDNFDNFTASGSTLYFFVSDNVHGKELWKSDGTAAGTSLVKDVNPGPDTSQSPYQFNQIAAVNGTIFFAADDNIHGQELFKTEGTAAGTSLVKDISLQELDFFYTSLENRDVIILGTSVDDTIVVSEVIHDENTATFTMTRNGVTKSEEIDAASAFLISAGDGNDRIDSTGLAGAEINGGDGNDTVFAGPGADAIIGGFGNDEIHAGAGNDKIHGGGGRDTISGNAGSDRIEGAAGDDILSGNGGQDRIYGGGGNDLIYGGASPDRLYGDNGNDQLFGGGGNDHLYADDPGQDTLHGGPGDDFLVAKNDHAIDHLFGDSGSDSALADKDDILNSVTNL